MSARPVLEPAAASRAAFVVWLVLALLAAARAALAFIHSTWAWSLGPLRFLPPLPGWGLWAIAALALAPPIARRVAPRLARLGDALSDAPGSASFAAAAGAVLLVWLLPDRAGFVGDFLLRENTLETGNISLSHWYPQALPLDLFLHHHLARTLMLATGMGGNTAGRVIGASDAALMGWLAVRLARELGLRGLAALAAASIVFWTGALTLFTGYNKGFSEMAVLIAALGVFGIRVARSGRGLLPLMLVAAAGFALHRAALGVLPALALVVLLAIRARGNDLLRRPSTWVALAAPAISLGAMLPRILYILAHVDPIHFTPPEPGKGVLASAFAGARPADMLNLIVMLSPVALAAPGVLLCGPAAWRRRDGAVLVALALPFVALIPFIHAQQGLFRDWDDFAAAGVAVSMVAAWLLSELLRGAPTRAWLAVPLALAALAPSLSWLVHANDLDGTLVRAQAFAEEPPARTGFERAMTWQYLGIVNLANHRPAKAAAAYAHAAELLSSPYILRQWGAAETAAGHPTEALRVFHTLLSRIPDDLLALRGVALISEHFGDTAQARAAAESLLRVSPDDGVASKVLGRIGRGPPHDAGTRP